MSEDNKKINQLFIRFPLKDQILFTKRLGTLVRAGVPLLRSLEILKKQMRTRGLNRVISILIQDVQNGKYLSTSLAQFKNIFGDLTINLINVGEMSGTLHENLEYLSEELKKKQALRRKIIGSLVYPFFIIFATLGVTGLLTLFVFPKILPIFRSLDFELPWTTKVLLAVSTFLIAYWYWVLLCFVALVVLFIVMMRFDFFKYWVHRIILATPIFGNLSQSYQMSNIFRTLGILLRTDVPIVRSARITANTNLNLVYQYELQEVAERITGGGRISEYMSKKPRLFPPVVSQMAAVGEEAGNLSETFIFLGEMYENEVDEMTKNLTTVIEPMLMVFMGLVVGFIAVSIITPIYEITQNIKP